MQAFKADRRAAAGDEDDDEEEEEEEEEDGSSSSSSKDEADAGVAHGAQLTDTDSGGAVDQGH